MNVLRPGDVEQLQQLEESLWRSETRFDREHLERVFHPEFLEFGRSGRIWTREASLTMAPGEIDAQLPLPDFAVSPLDANTVLVTYTSIVRQQTRDVSNRSSIWIRTNGAWQLRFHQATPTRSLAGNGAGR